VLRRRFVRRHFVEETFCKETFCKETFCMCVIVSFQRPELLKVKQHKYSYAIKFELAKIVSLQTPEAFSDEARQLLLLLLLF
jgi:hypothetical protein